MFVDSFNEIVRSKYSWLYNNLFLCKTDSTDHGCIIEGKNTYNGYGTSGSGCTHAYWTSTTVGMSSSNNGVWNVGNYGRLGQESVNVAHRGIRPVITIPKSIISK